MNSEGTSVIAAADFIRLRCLQVDSLETLPPIG